MEGRAKPIVQYLESAEKRFIIPVYQRTYSWKTENCKQLYDDLVKLVQTHRKTISLEVWSASRALVLMSFLL